MKKKTLLLLVPKLWLGGQERVAAKTAELLRNDCQVTLVVFDGADAVYHPDCEIIDLKIPAQDGTLHKIVNVFRRVRSMKRLRRERHADYVYSFGTTANLVNALSRGVGQTVIGLRGFLSVAAMGRAYRYVFSHSDKIVACAEAMADAIRHAYPQHREKVCCQYNPVDVEMICQNGREPIDDYAFSAHTVISHGRLDSIKNWPRLINAFSLIRAKLPDAQLVIIGEGSEREALERLIDGLGLRDSVRLIGFRANPFAYLAKASLFVLPSYFEGFPNALVEGMVFLPVVSADCKSGPREILSTGPVDRVAQGYEIADYGVLVQPASDRAFHAELTRDDEILAEAMLRVLEDPALSARLKAAARRRAEDFSCESYRAHLMKILEEPVKGSCE